MRMPGRGLLPSILVLVLVAVGVWYPLQADHQGGGQPSRDRSVSSAAKEAGAIVGQVKSPGLPLGKGFDFYVLSLSWSPSYCAAEGADADQQQCAAGRPYGFIVHGLWPQFERGFPQDCQTDEPNVEAPLRKSLYDILPSAGLVVHQWRKHGTCSGLGQRDYFRVVRAARERVAVPQQFRRLADYRRLAPREAEAAFLAVNPGMTPEGIAVDCDRRYLREVRICMTKGLAFRSCPQVDRRACTLPKVVMPPVRGG